MSASEESRDQMKGWVHEKIRGLLSRVSEEIDKTIPNPSEERVHDLRTSIRRTRESLTVFQDFFPEDGVKSVRKKLQRVMQTAAEIRNRDIALELLSNSGTGSPRLKRSLETERERYREELLKELNDVRIRKMESAWKDDLRL